MELNEYQRKAMSTCLKTSDNYGYMNDGLTEERGELAGVVSKAIRKGKMVLNHNQLQFTTDATVDEINSITNNLKKELGDILWMVAGMARVLGLSLEEVAQANIDKLADRAKRNVIDGSGDNR